MPPSSPSFLSPNAPLHSHPPVVTQVRGCVPQPAASLPGLLADCALVQLFTGFRLVFINRRDRCKGHQGCQRHASKSVTIQNQKWFFFLHVDPSAAAMCLRAKVPLVRAARGHKPHSVHVIEYGSLRGVRSAVDVRQLASVGADVRKIASSSRCPEVPDTQKRVYHRMSRCFAGLLMQSRQRWTVPRRCAFQSRTRTTCASRRLCWRVPIEPQLRAAARWRAPPL